MEYTCLAYFHAVHPCGPLARILTHRVYGVPRFTLLVSSVIVVDPVAPPVVCAAHADEESFAPSVMVEFLTNCVCSSTLVNQCLESAAVATAHVNVVTLVDEEDNAAAIVGTFGNMMSYDFVLHSETLGVIVTVVLFVFFSWNGSRFPRTLNSTAFSCVFVFG